MKLVTEILGGPQAETAKEDFVRRSGMLDENRLFSDEQLTLFDGKDLPC